MRVIIEVQSFVLVDVPDASTADDVGCILCSQVDMAIYETPEENGARHAQIDTHFSVWGEKECDWLDGDKCGRASKRLDGKSGKAK